MTHARRSNRSLAAIAITLASTAIGAQPEPDGPVAEPPAAEPPAASAPAADAPAATPTPADSNEAVRIFEAAARAIKDAKSMTFRAVYLPSGAIADLISGAEGTVRMVRATTPVTSANGTVEAAPGRWVAAFQGAGATSKSQSRIEFSCVWIGDYVEWLEPSKKQLVERRSMDARSPVLQSSKNIRLEDLFSPDPFKREIESASLKLVERREVAGVECDIIELSRGTRTEQWAIATRDRIPRQQVRITTGTYGGELTLTLHDVRVDSAGSGLGFTPADLRLAKPDDYTEDRQINAPPPPPTPRPATPAQPSPGTTGAPSATSGASAAAAPSPSIAAPAPTIVPDFELKTPAGEAVTLASLRDQVVLLDFFGTWSLAATDWHPRLDEIAKEFKDRGVRVYSCTVREKDPRAAQAYHADSKFTFGLLLNAEGVAKSTGVRAFPGCAVIGKQGELIGVEQPCKGDDSAAALRRLVGRALGEAVADPPAPKDDVPPADAASDAKPDSKPEASKDMTVKEVRDSRRATAHVAVPPPKPVTRTGKEQ